MKINQNMTPINGVCDDAWKFSVLAYDKDNDSYTSFGKFKLLSDAALLAERLAQRVSQGSLLHKLRDGGTEPYDWIEIVGKDQDSEPIWVSDGKDVKLPLWTTKPSENTLVEYLYRDASNYKVHPEEGNFGIVAGTLTEAEIEEIFSCCDGEDHYFIPHVVGLNEERFQDTTADDHPYFELLNIETTTNKPNTGMTAKELLEKFCACKGKWDSKI